MLNSTEKIGRIENTELESGAHKYGFMLAPGVATPEEWKREIAARARPSIHAAHEIHLVAIGSAFRRLGSISAPHWTQTP